MLFVTVLNKATFLINRSPEEKKEFIIHFCSSKIIFTDKRRVQIRGLLLQYEGIWISKKMFKILYKYLLAEVIQVLIYRI